MISRENVKQLVTNEIEGSDIILVDVQVSTSNQIKVVLDSLEGVNIDKCVEISRLIEGNFDREVEDFELEVSSYGISQPFILPFHYQKNIGKKVEIYYKEGKNIKGTLKNVYLTTDENIEEIEIVIKKKIKPEGKKKKIEIEEVVKIAGSEIQKIRLVPIF